MPIARCLRVLLTAVCLSLAIPALAAAATYTVNSTVDEEDASSGTGVCETSTPGECTLRAALETSNASAGVDDEINFSAAFNGQAEDTIVPFLGPLPAVEDEVVISGTGVEPCTTELGPKGPCVGLNGGGLEVKAENVTIRGIAITGTELAINVTNGSVGFVAEGNWFGIDLEGEFSQGTPRGIYIGPGADSALIGDDTVAERNVFAHSETYGLWINGASNTVVRGNYFGVDPDGTTEGKNGRNIVVTDDEVGGEKAENTEIGEKIEEAGGPTAACDEGCNVIAASEEHGINLISLGGGGDPATGPTTIHGNYIGLDATGLGVLGNAQAGIDVGAAGEVDIGGEEAGDANYFAGGTVGVRIEGGVAPEVIGNAFGIDGEGNSVTPPSNGILVSSDGLSDPQDGSLIAGNQMRMTGGVGIEHEELGAEIADNFVEGAMIGIRTFGDNTPAASTIEGNEVFGAEDIGILVNNPKNTIAGNEVFGSGESGIVVDPEDSVDVSGNIIGGDTADDENLISESGTAAIEIVGLESSRNEVRRNRGKENDFRFLRLVPYGAEGDPNGIKEPKEVKATKTEASGTGVAGATVRVFWKASSEEGEIAGFLAETTVDGSGKWKATYAPQPEGTRLIATQTLNGGTSDLSSVATTPPDPPVPPSGCPAVPSACPPPPPPPPDTTKPKVTIKKAPKAKSTATTAKFVFSSSKSGSKFKCKLDSKAFANCTSPKTYKKLKPGKHVFKVKATDAAGNVSAVVTKKFTVLPPG